MSIKDNSQKTSVWPLVYSFFCSLFCTHILHNHSLDFNHQVLWPHSDIRPIVSANHPKIIRYKFEELNTFFWNFSLLVSIVRILLSNECWMALSLVTFKMGKFPFLFDMTTEYWCILFIEICVDKMKHSFDWIFHYLLAHSLNFSKF